MKKKIRLDVKDVRLKSKNRPEHVDKRPQRVLFSTAGPTGWRRRRNLGDYKGDKKEGDFSHLHEKFWGEEMSLYE